MFYFLFYLICVLLIVEPKPTAPRCWNPNNAPEYATNQNKWHKTHLTYRIYNYTKRLSKSEIRETFREAISAWTKGVNLHLLETTSKRADIRIYFTKQDGPSNTLGYAYYPEDGDIYLDKDEDWTTSAVMLEDSQIYFRWVAAHELGHALGLPHSETMKSVMHPYYSTSVTNAAKEDNKDLRALYGEAVLNNSHLCHGATIDAILDSPKRILITGNQFYTFTNGIIQNGPTYLDMIYPGLPNKIDAAFSVDSKIFFLSKNIYYRFTHKKTKSTKKLISAGFNNVPSNIDAAFYDSNKKIIYFFKGANYYAINTQLPVRKRLVVNGKKLEKDWQGVPTDLEAATFINSSAALFIKKKKCYFVDLKNKKVKSTKDCSKAIYKC